MKAYKCDICGDVFAPVNYRGTERCPRIIITHEPEFLFDNVKRIDVCPLCMEDINTLIETRRKTNES